MKLSELIKDMPYLLDTQGDMDIDIGAVSCNSREKTDHGLFFCIAGCLLYTSPSPRDCS